jgi:hypothetical protein
MASNALSIPTVPICIPRDVRHVERKQQQVLARGIAPNLPKTAKPIDFTRLKLRKHLLAARIDRRHVEPRTSAVNDPSRE